MQAIADVQGVWRAQRTQLRGDARELGADAALREKQHAPWGRGEGRAGVVACEIEPAVADRRSVRRWQRQARSGAAPQLAEQQEIVRERLGAPARREVVGGVSRPERTVLDLGDGQPAPVGDLGEDLMHEAIADHLHDELGLYPVEQPFVARSQASGRKDRRPDPALDCSQWRRGPERPDEVAAQLGELAVHGVAEAAAAQLVRAEAQVREHER
jgi:hypothetical protein